MLPVGEFILRLLRPGDSGAWFGYLSDRRTTEHTRWPEVSAVMVAGIVDRLIGEYVSRASPRVGAGANERRRSGRYLWVHASRRRQGGGRIGLRPRSGLLGSES